MIQFILALVALLCCAGSFRAIEVDVSGMCYEECWPSQKASSARVAIIGAGFSGLAAAYELIKREYEVAVYEARNRVGGRVFSVLMQDSNGVRHAAELGAQNICDGGEAEHLRSLAAELGLSIKASSYPVSMMEYNDGTERSFPESQLQKYQFNSELLWDRLVELRTVSQNMEAVLQKLFPDDGLLRQFFTLRLVCYEGGSTERLSSLYISTLYRMIEGTLYQGSQECATTQVLSIEGGNGKIAEEIAIRLGDRVHLNKVLTSIAKASDGTFVLHFQDGDLVVADIVVLTMPCPIYRDIVFEAGVMSNEQLEDIRSIQYGGNAKILVPVTEEVTSRPIANSCAVAWKIGVNDPVTLYYREPYGCFAQETLQSKLEQDLPIVSVLHTVCSHIAAPCIARDESFAVYEGIVGQSWPLDPFSRGSYSYINAGKEALCMEQGKYEDEPIRTLFTPAGNLFFAGEHTTILLDILGTMEAAIESGVRTARMVDQKVHSDRKKAHSYEWALL